MSALGPVRKLARRPVAELRAFVDRFVDRKIDDQIRQRTGLVPIDETDPNDVFICGFPKSGNTWFQHMVSALVFGIDVSVAPDALINDLSPDVHFKRYYRRFRDVVFFKTHHLPQPRYRRVVYLVRDGRDAMVSYYHHLTAMNGDTSFLDMVTTGRGMFPSKWHEHVDAYRHNPHGASLIAIRYEDLKANPQAELRRFCTFAGLERDDEALARAIDRSSFESMKKKEQATGWETPGWPTDKSFVRRGQVGSFKDEMPPEVLAAFMADAARTMRSEGY